MKLFSILAAVVMLSVLAGCSGTSSSGNRANTLPTVPPSLKPISEGEKNVMLSLAAQGKVALGSVGEAFGANLEEVMADINKYSPPKTAIKVPADYQTAVGKVITNCKVRRTTETATTTGAQRLTRWHDSQIDKVCSVGFGAATTSSAGTVPNQGNLATVQSNLTLDFSAVAAGFADTDILAVSVNETKQSFSRPLVNNDHTRPSSAQTRNSMSASMTLKNGESVSVEMGETVSKMGSYIDDTEIREVGTRTLTMVLTTNSAQVAYEKVINYLGDGKTSTQISLNKDLIYSTR